MPPKTNINKIHQSTRLPQITNRFNEQWINDQYCNMLLSKAVSWESTKPSYAQYPLVVHKMRMMASVGSHVVIEVSTDVDKQLMSDYTRDGIMIATIVSYTSETNITCVVYKVGEVNELANNNLIPIQSGSGYGLQELMKTKYTVVVSEKDIIDYAFIFTLEDIEEDLINFYGITNCYLLRFQIDDGIIIDIINYLTFPCESDDYYFSQRSYHAKIWYGICKIQDALWKVMNSQSERQVTVVRVPLSIEDITLDYIAYRCVGGVNKVKINTRGRIRSITTKGLKRKSGRARNKLHLLRFETTAQMLLLRSIIGSTSTVGIRRRRPKLGCTDKLDYNNTINLILGIDNDDVQQNALTVHKYIHHDSIDLVADEYESYMVVRYDSYIYNHHGISNEMIDVSNNTYVNEVTSAISQNTINENDRYSSIRVGQILSRGEHCLFEISSVTPDHAVLRYVDPEEMAGQEIIERDFTLLDQQIQDYNS